MTTIALARMPESTKASHGAVEAIRTLRLAGEARAAAELGEPFATVARDDIAFLFEYGEALRAAGEWRKAVDVHRRYAQLRGEDDPEAIRTLSITEATYGLPTAWLSRTEVLADARSDERGYVFARAYVLARVGRYREALALVDPLVESRLDDAEAAILRAQCSAALEWPRWQDDARHVIAVARPAIAELHRAHLAIGAAEFDVAAEALGRALSSDPQSAEIHGELGVLLATVDRLSPGVSDHAVRAKSRELLERAVVLAPDDGVMEGRLLELCAVNFGEPVDLAAALLRAKDRPHAGLPRYLARIGHRALGDDVLAEVSYRAWLACCEEDVRARWEYAGFLAERGRDDDAARELDRVLTISPTFAAAWADLGALHVRREEWGRAVEAYESAIRLEHAPLEMRDSYAAALIEVGRAGDAVGVLEAAMDEEPGNEARGAMLELSRARRMGL